MNLRQYIAESTQTYHYRVKTTEPLDDASLDKIERVILKYDPIGISEVRKTIFQKNPLDFADVSNAEIYIVDLEFSLPASVSVLQNDIRTALGVAEKMVVVRGWNDPTEIETQRLNAKDEMDEEAKKDGLTQKAALESPHYEDAPDTKTDLYGTERNSRFLNYLASIEKERKEKMKVDPKSPLFSWMDMPDETEADNAKFNADIKDAPKLGDAKGDMPDDDLGVRGIETDEGKKYRRIYKKNGKEIVINKQAPSFKSK
jgi:hypothetical protein